MGQLKKKVKVRDIKWGELKHALFNKSEEAIRNHWFNNLDPCFVNGQWYLEEMWTLFILVSEHNLSPEDAQQFLDARTLSDIVGLLRQWDPAERKSMQLKLDSYYKV